MFSEKLLGIPAAMYDLIDAEFTVIDSLASGRPWPTFSILLTRVGQLKVFLEGKIGAVTFRPL